MSTHGAREILALLGIKIAPELVEKLDKYLAVANEVAHEDPSKGSILVLIGTGTQVIALFVHGPGGSTPSDKLGVGAFGGAKVPAETTVNVTGNKIEVRHKGFIAWSGTGGQEGLEGDYEIEF